MGAAGLQMPVGWQARALAPTFNFRLHSAKKKGLAQQKVEDIIDIFYTTKRCGAWRERECIRKCKEKLVRKFSFLNDIKFVILIKLNGTVADDATARVKLHPSHLRKVQSADRSTQLRVRDPASHTRHIYRNAKMRDRFYIK